MLLTKGKVAIVDDDYTPPAKFHYDESTGYARCGGKLKAYLHRHVLGITDPEIEVDHRNGNKLDCQRHNLRTATVSQNAMNKKVKHNSTTGYKGVMPYGDGIKRRKPYRSRIQHPESKKYISLGNYATPEEAAEAYNKAALELYGEFALLNVIRS